MFKEFVLYNAPCFNCKSKISIELNIHNHTGDISPSAMLSNINCSVFKNFTDINLKVSYHDSLHLKIIHKTNIFETNNIKRLKNFFETHDVFVASACTGCFSYADSSILELDYKYFRIKPISVISEHISLQHNDMHCYIDTNFIKNKSEISAFINGKHSLNVTTDAININKLKNKEAFFKKIKTYITFS